MGFGVPPLARGGPNDRDNVNRGNPGFLQKLAQALPQLISLGIAGGVGGIGGAGAVGREFTRQRERQEDRQERERRQAQDAALRKALIEIAGEQSLEQIGARGDETRTTQLERDLRAAQEAERGREFTGGQNELDRKLRERLEQERQEFQLSQAEIQREFEASQKNLDREQRAELAKLDVQSRRDLAEANQQFRKELGAIEASRDVSSADAKRLAQTLATQAANDPFGNFSLSKFNVIYRALMANAGFDVEIPEEDIDALNEEDEGLGTPNLDNLRERFGVGRP